MAFENMAKLSWIYDLYRLGQDSALREKPAEVQRRILEHIVQGIDADTGSLSVRVDGEDELELIAGIGIPPVISRTNMEKPFRRHGGFLS